MSREPLLLNSKRVWHIQPNHHSGASSPYPQLFVRGQLVLVPPLDALCDVKLKAASLAPGVSVKTFMNPHTKCECVAKLGAVEYRAVWKVLGEVQTRCRLLQHIGAFDRKVIHQIIQRAARVFKRTAMPELILCEELLQAQKMDTYHSNLLGRTAKFLVISFYKRWFGLFEG